MCGIAGIITPTPALLDAGLVRQLFDLQAARGPDDRGILGYAAGETWLGRAWEARPTEAALLHWRLAILDLTEAGWQPMISPDGRCAIVFNGEIYNYLELRDELAALGHTFRSQSDTEVLLAAYVQWGAAALPRLVGMFAFAVLDTAARRLFLARDPFGIKPLYYTTAAGGLAFASEIKTLLALPGVGRAVQPERLFAYLRFGLTDHGGDTLFADVRQLPAAHYLEVSLGDPLRVGQPVRYWALSDDRAELSFDAAADRLRELFLENVRLHLRSDVPVGSALSGGVDSSAIVAAMRWLQGDALDLHTFTYVAEDLALSEANWAQQAGDAARAVRHTVQPSAADLAADLDALIAVQDEPFGSTSIYAQYRVFRLAAEAGIKVMLDGQGADEMLAGYATYRAARLATLVRAGRWAEALRFTQAAARWPDSPGRWLLASVSRYVLPPAWHGPLRRLVGQEVVPDWLNADWFAARGAGLAAPDTRFDGDILRARLRQTLFESSLPALLRYEDRNSMAFSIESRVPFLTPALVDFVLSLPEQYIIAPDGTTKAVFRAAMRGIVPDAILDRRDKIGFQTPERRWLTALRPWVEGVLAGEAAHAIPALRPGAIQAEWAAVLAGRRRFDFTVWRWLNLIRWTERFGIRFDA